jgi:transposase
MDQPPCLGCQERDARIAVLEGRVASCERRIDESLGLVEKRDQAIDRLKYELDRIKQRLAQYEPEIQHEKTPSTSRPDGSSCRYSLESEERRRQRRRRRKKKSPGRRPTELKFADVEWIENIYPAGARRAECELVRARPVWRLKDGRAVLIGYRVYRAPGGAEGRIPGVTPRCECGIEILVVLGFLVYVIGMSLDKACAVLEFFCQLKLAKSEADALLRQLARHWQGEFETLCDLIARAAVVYMDETGWKVGSQACSLWTFAAKLQRVFLFGCHKDADTLDAMLPRDVFDGIAVSDDAAVYRGRFRRAQKCWAHLLRKAIRLALLYPRKTTYQRFLDQLLRLYYDAKRAAADERLAERGRQQRVSELEDRLYALCRAYWNNSRSDNKPHARDFANLVNELVERGMDEELFTFVLEPQVQPTNNLSERLQRSPAQDRQACRTNKTAAGAQRRSVIVSVLESLRANLDAFTLAKVLDEVGTWMKEGISLFTQQWQDLIASRPVPVFNSG